MCHLIRPASTVKTVCSTEGGGGRPPQEFPNAAAGCTCARARTWRVCACAEQGIPTGVPPRPPQQWRPAPPADPGVLPDPQAVPTQPPLVLLPALTSRACISTPSPHRSVSRWGAPPPAWGCRRSCGSLSALPSSVQLLHFSLRCQAGGFPGRAFFSCFSAPFQGCCCPPDAFSSLFFFFFPCVLSP